MQEKNKKYVWRTIWKYICIACFYIEWKNKWKEETFQEDKLNRKIVYYVLHALFSFK